MSGVREFQTRIAQLQERAPFKALPACYRCSDTKFERADSGELARCQACNPEPFCPGTPAEFEELTFDTYRPMPGNRAALALARAFLDGGRDLYLHGAVGAGKTALAICITTASHHVKRGTALFQRVPLLLHRLEPSQAAEARLALEERVVKVPLLVLDDIGAERDIATSFTRTTLLMLYEARKDRGRRTILTSNLSLDQLALQQGDDRLASRIAGWADVASVTCDDQRVAGPRGQR